MDVNTKRKREPAPTSPMTAEEVNKALATDKATQNAYHSIARDTRKRRGCRDDDVEPIQGTIIHSLWRHWHLERRELIAWKRLCHDIELSVGDSGPLTVSYSERVSTSVAGAPRSESDREEEFNAIGLSGMRMAHWNPEWESANEKLGTLRSDELAIIGQLLRDHIRIVRHLKIHHHDLAYLGEYFCGYKDNRQSLSAITSRIQGILTHLANMYLIQTP